jgi:hypothetical protein
MRLLATALLIGHTFVKGASCILPGTRSQPIWSSNNSQYVLLRKEFNLSSSSKVSSGCIAITAAQCNDKLLASYKLWLNGVAISNGPGRNMNATQGYDVVQIVPTLLKATNVIAIQAYHNGNPSSSAKVLVNFALTFVDGTSQAVPSDVTWSALGVDNLFNPYHGCLGGMYCAPKEYLDARMYPIGWRLPGFERNPTAFPLLKSKASASEWPTAVNHTAFELPLVPKAALPITQYEMHAAKITEITSNQCLIALDNTHDLAVLSCNGTDVITKVYKNCAHQHDSFSLCPAWVLQRIKAGVCLVRPSHGHLHRSDIICCCTHGALI